MALSRVAVILLVACGGSAAPAAAPVGASNLAPADAAVESTTFQSLDICREYAAEVDAYAACAKAPPSQVSEARAHRATLVADPNVGADICDAALSLLRLTEEQEGCDQH